MGNINRKAAIRRRRIFIACCSLVLALAIVVFSVSLRGIIKILNQPAQSKAESSSVTVSDDNSSEDTVKKIATATVVNTGDILIHNPVLAGAETASGEYDFSKLFSKVSSHFKKADLAVLNLEVSLGGEGSGDYSGYPAFNTPDVLIDNLIDAGASLLLTANNHCYDTGFYGLQRTVQVLKEKGIAYTGTREKADEPNYLVKDVNGIKIGMACYTYSTIPTDGRIAINGATIKTEANSLINTFCYDNLDKFYTEAQNMIDSMRADGADCTVFYMHWGNEYQLKPNEWQKTMAQKLCNMGVDVIVGGHPHVIQPIEMLYAEGSEHTTVCLYSMGNAVSNQRREELTDLCTTGHTEDGLLFYYTFDKYSDGTTVLSAVDAIPTWVNKVGARYKAEYIVYPLETAASGKEYNLGNSVTSLMEQSYERTRELLESGLTQCQNALGCDIRFE